ncbi:hypothetical protein [Escherichia phage vB_EcoM-Ro121c4YLVW]|nr:peptidase HslV family [Escherichia phage vB_EcoM-Ro121c4YLVW]AVZ45396.1 hypothetical protein [Escherichia phage vB_EcoM-Ro121c4YLVW]
MIHSDPDKEDEEFIALVVHPDGRIFLHEGNNPTRAYPIDEEYYAVGSGSDFALAALDAGATPEQAMEVAKKRDAFSGGETFIEEQDEIIELTDDDLENFSKEELINLLKFGNPYGEEEPRNVAGNEADTEEKSVAENNLTSKSENINLVNVADFEGTAI